METITVDELDLLRLRIDELAQNAKCGIIEMNENVQSAYNCLLMAKAKLGKAKGELGIKTPYVVANEVTNIPKTDAVAVAEIFLKEESSALSNLIPVQNNNERIRLSNINIMRDKIKEVQNIMECGKFGNGYYSQSFQHLDEASIWFGFELQRMRENR